MAVATKELEPEIIWRPQPGRQKALIDAPHSLIGYGGARGGGKTAGVVGKFALLEQKHGANFNAIFFRHSLPQADDLIEEARAIYEPLGAEWKAQAKQFLMPNGGRIRFRSLETVEDARKYQGQNLTHAAVEEAGQYPDPEPIWRLFGALRSKGGVPVQLILTFNPGGVGHLWLKKKFVDPAPLGMETLYWELENGDRVPYIFIPAKVQDNQILLQKDPGYVTRLHMVGSPQLVKAWLEGDWNIIEGAYYPEFALRHIIKPFSIPRHWEKYAGFDWGHHSPFCMVWAAVSSGKDDKGNEVPYPKGSLVVYREYTDKGVTNANIAREIIALEGDEEITTRAADTQIFNEMGGYSINDDFVRNGVYFQPADKDRISGANEIRRRLAPDPAQIYFFETCEYLIATLPALPISPRNAEDVDTKADDHGYDALRYLCKIPVLVSEYTVPEPEIKMGQVNVTRYIQEAKRKNRRPKI